MHQPSNNSKPSSDDSSGTSDGEDILRFFDYSEPPPLDLKPLRTLQQNVDKKPAVPVARPPPPARLPSRPSSSNHHGGPSRSAAANKAVKNEGSPWDIVFIEALLQRLAREVDVNLGIDSQSYSKPLTVPYAPGDFDCNGCYNLRDIMHTNGTRNVRVTLHGGKDVFDHLLFQIEIFDQSSVHLEHYYLDLSHHPFMWTKWLLALYLNFVIEDGSAVLMDFASTFYNYVEDAKHEFSASSSSSSGSGNDQLRPEGPAADDQTIASSQSKRMDSGEGSSNLAVVARPSDAAPQQEPSRPVPRPRVRSRSKLPKTGLALQRERAGNLTLEDLSPFFNRPIMHAARELGFCSTAIKHACRRIGIGRWPSRKLNSVGRQIDNLERELRNITDRSRIRDINNEIEKLKAQRDRLRNGDQD